jgi:23S rRNA (adenine1618-N6)-methyltransferase
MSKEKKKSLKSKIHSRNKNKDKYDLGALLSLNAELGNYLKPNHKGEDSVDLSNPNAVKLLNQALLSYYYGIKNWNFSDNNICPTIPNKADYIHYMADILMGSNFGNLPEGNHITCLDIGTGATCIYPIIGAVEYNWNFIASEINKESISTAKAIIKSNTILTNKVDCRLQPKAKDIIYGVLNRDEKIDITICNPPLYNSIEEARKEFQKKGSLYKLLDHANEMICDGGETKFLKQYIKESRAFGDNCFWFSSLVSKPSNQKAMADFLKLIGATEIKAIAIGLGHKPKQLLIWSFLTKEAQKTWRETKWRAQN